MSGSGRESHAPPPRIPERTVWIDGRLVSGSEAALSLFDRGARDGEGLFETLRVYGGRPFHWRRHLERLVLSAAELGFPVPPAPSVLAGALEQVLAAERLEDAAARITVTRGVPGTRPTRAGCWIEAEPIRARLWSGTRDAATVVFSKRPFHPGPLGRYKTTSRLAYALAREEARAARADEALLVSPEGLVLEGATTNVFAVHEGAVLTPALATGILPGVTRRWVLEACGRLGLAAREAAIPRAWIEEESREVFLTNALQEIVPVDRLQGRALPERTIASRLLGLYRADVAARVEEESWPREHTP